MTLLFVEKTLEFGATSKSSNSCHHFSHRFSKCIVYVGPSWVVHSWSQQERKVLKVQINGQTVVRFVGLFCCSLLTIEQAAVKMTPSRAKLLASPRKGTKVAASSSAKLLSSSVKGSWYPGFLEFEDDGKWL